MLMTMLDGPVLNLPWTNHKLHHNSAKHENNQISIKGAVMISSGCVSWSSFIVLQVSVFLKTFIHIQFLQVYLIMQCHYNDEFSPIVTSVGNHTEVLPS